MFVSLVKPEFLEPKELDNYLKAGCFRLGENMFTTSFLTFNNVLYNALWLRVNLSDFRPKKSQQQLLKKVDNKFRVEIKPFMFTDEKSDLFLRYREGVDFEPSSHLNYIVSDGYGIFNSYNVCIYDGSKLIACGIFDLGQESAQGIVSFYDPDYKKYSLGKVLVLYKLQFLSENGYSWFYPGYVAPGFSRFEYKLDIARENSEYYDIRSGNWIHFGLLDTNTLPLEKTKTALEQLQNLLDVSEFSSFSLKSYRFFDIGIDSNYAEYRLLEQPYFIYCFANMGIEDVIITYDIFEEVYKLVVCKKLFQVTMPAKEGSYTDFLLKEDRVIFQEQNVTNFYMALNVILKREPQVVVSRNLDISNNDF